MSSHGTFRWWYVTHHCNSQLGHHCTCGSWCLLELGHYLTQYWLQNRLYIFSSITDFRGVSVDVTTPLQIANDFSYEFSWHFQVMIYYTPMQFSTWSSLYLWFLVPIGTRPLSDTVLTAKYISYFSSITDFKGVSVDVTTPLQMANEFSWVLMALSGVNTLRPRLNGCHFIFK